MPLWTPGSRAGTARMLTCSVDIPRLLVRGPAWLAEREAKTPTGGCRTNVAVSVTTVSALTEEPCRFCQQPRPRPAQRPDPASLVLATAAMFAVTESGCAHLFATAAPLPKTSTMNRPAAGERD